jgi:membrane protease YdiL (CAAX protease family)
MGYNNYNWDHHNSNNNQHKHIIRRDSNFVGLVAVSQTVLLQLLFTIMFIGFSAVGILNPNSDKYFGVDNTGFLLFYSIVYIIGVGLPGPVIAIISRRNIRPFSRLELTTDKEPRFLSVILALMAGVAVCIIANFITSYIVYFFNLFGLYPPEMPTYLENNTGSLLLNILVFALLPAILEEMVYRGYILRTLLPHGKRLAIVVSSLMFALMHGNILQIPFAFIVGITCGYLAVKTGSIWIPILLHFLNNFMSVLLQYAGLNLTDTQNQKVIMIVFSLLGIIGLFALLFLFASDDPIIRNDKKQPRQKSAIGALLSAPAMIVSFAVSLIITIFTTRFGG